MPKARQRIRFDPTLSAGKPVVGGTGLPVDFVIGLLAEGGSEADILETYPGLSREDIAACLAYARDLIRRDQAARSERAERLAALEASIEHGVADSLAGRVHDAGELFDRLEAKYEAMVVAADR